jgi:hypothetical protein
MDFGTALLTALEKGGTGAVIAGMLIWYLKARDSKPEPKADAEPHARPGRVERLEDAILSIATQTGRQTEILDRQTDLLEKCADGHSDTKLALARMEMKLDARRMN